MRSRQYVTPKIALRSTKNLCEALNVCFWVPLSRDWHQVGQMVCLFGRPFGPFLAIDAKGPPRLVPFLRLMQMGPPLCPIGPFSAIVLSNGVPIMHLLISTFVWMELTMMYRSAISIAFPHSGKEKSEERPPRLSLEFRLEQRFNPGLLWG